MRASQLMEEGFYVESEDYIEVVLRLAPASYYKACEDQLSLLSKLKAKRGGKKDG